MRSGECGGSQKRPILSHTADFGSVILCAALHRREKAILFWSAVLVAYTWLLYCVPPWLKVSCCRNGVMPWGGAWNYSSRSFKWAQNKGSMWKSFLCTVGWKSWKCRMDYIAFIFMHLCCCESDTWITWQNWKWIFWQDYWLLYFWESDDEMLGNFINWIVEVKKRLCCSDTSFSLFRLLLLPMFDIHICWLGGCNFPVFSFL